MLEFDGVAAARKRRSTRRIVALLCALASVAAIAGLLLHWLLPDYDPRFSGTGGVGFSPDGKTVAYLWDAIRAKELAKSQEGKYCRIEKWLDLRWFPLGQKGAEKSLRIWQRTWPRIKIMGFLPMAPYSAAAFSPDGRHIVVHSPHDLVFVELATGRKWKLTHEGERIWSCAWVAGEEVAYATIVAREGEPYLAAVWRRKIRALSKERTLVYRGLVKRGVVPRDWSPNGRYVILSGYNQETNVTQGILLDVRTGRARNLPILQELYYVRWRPDSSLAALQCQWDRGPSYVLDPVTADLTDLSQRLATAFANCEVYGIDSGWTADGRYLLVQTMRELKLAPGQYSAWLVRPKPWELVSVGPDMLRPTSVPGWVLYGTPGTGQYGFNYVTRQFVPLKPTIGPEFSPDGKWAFEGGFHPLRAYPVNLPPARPD